MLSGCSDKDKKLSVTDQMETIFSDDYRSRHEIKQISSRVIGRVEEVIFFSNDDVLVRTFQLDSNYNQVDNPEFYFYERDVSLISFLSIIYPLMGTGIFLIPKKNAW